jgi:hypothetical protein
VVVVGVVAAGCGSGDTGRNSSVDAQAGPVSAEGGDADATAEAADSMSASDASDGSDPGDVAPEASAPDAGAGQIAGSILNDTASDFAVPDGTTFQVSVVDVPGLSIVVRANQHQYAYTIGSVPAGAHTLRVQEYDSSGNDSYDFYQDATRQVSPVVVAPAQTATADFHLRWHWEAHRADGGPQMPTCSGARQIYFRDALHGIITYKEESATNGVGYLHGAVMRTSDGGATWAVAANNMVADGAQPWMVPDGGNWFQNRHLYATPGGEVALSLGENGVIARSSDFGATWSRVAFQAPAWGTGNIFYGGIASSGTTLYVGAFAGGVQGSNDRFSISNSLDGGSTWNVLLDRCDLSDPGASCSSVNQPNLPLGFAGIDLACGPAGHCISVGGNQVLVTTDDFVTHTTYSALPSGFGCANSTTSARVVWLPTTNTVWVVVPASACGSPPVVRNVSTDGGLTWSGWQSSPISAGGFMSFGDAQTGFDLEARSVSVTHDGGQTLRYTGPAPGDSGSNEGLKLSVVDATHAWVMSQPAGNCNAGTFTDVAKWIQ